MQGGLDYEVRGSVVIHDHISLAKGVFCVNALHEGTQCFEYLFDAEPQIQGRHGNVPTFCAPIGTCQRTDLHSLVRADLCKGV
jgi:hypothetical protein